MALTEVNTEKVPGESITSVQIGYDSTHGVDIKTGVVDFTYKRIHDAKPKHASNTKATSNIFQPHSHYEWTLSLCSDCRVAFFATDVQVAGGNQYALDEDGDSSKIEYFKIIMTTESEAGTSKTRTYTITDGYVTRNHANITYGKDALYTYEGLAKEITYSDA